MSYLHHLNRSKNIPKFKLKLLYLKEKKSITEIAKLLNCSRGFVYDQLRKKKIKTRSISEGNTVRYSNSKNREIHRKYALEGRTGIHMPGNYTNGTSIERKFEDWATINSIQYIKQFKFKSNSHRYDFKIKGTNIIVECDGDWFHENENQKRKDKNFDIEAKNNNHIVYRFLGSEINKTKGKCFDRLFEFV